MQIGINIIFEYSITDVFLYNDGNMIDLEITFGFYHSYTWGINNKGQIVGFVSLCIIKTPSAYKIIFF